MSFNLNNTLSFAQATNSVPSNTIALAASILSNLSGKTTWQISEASFDGVKFHTFQNNENYNAALPSMQDANSRRKAIYKFPYVDGQTTVDLGLDGESWTFDCMFFGKYYLDGWQAFFNKLTTTTTPKTLVHPVRGNFSAVPLKWQFMYSSDRYMAIMVRVEFIEHNFNIASTSAAATSGLQGFLNQVQQALAPVKDHINRAITTLNQMNNDVATVVNLLTTPQNILSAALAAPAAFRSAILADMANITNLFGLRLLRLNSTYNAGNSIDIPAAVTVNSGGTAAITGAQVANAVSVGINPNSQGINVPLTSSVTPYTTQEAVQDVNSYADQVNAMISSIQANGQELLMYQTILDYQASIIALQNIVAAGVKSQQPQIINYVLPRDMSLREVAFVNGLTPDFLPQLDQMNPDLDSVNNVVQGTLVQVPVAVTL